MSSSKITSGLSPETLLQDVPQQSLQAATQCCATRILGCCFSAAANNVEDKFWCCSNICLHWNKDTVFYFPLHSVGLRHVMFRVAYWHTCKCTISAWKYTARTVLGASFLALVSFCQELSCAIPHNVML